MSSTIARAQAAVRAPPTERPDVTPPSPPGVTMEEHFNDIYKTNRLAVRFRNLEFTGGALRYVNLSAHPDFPLATLGSNGNLYPVQFENDDERAAGRAGDIWSSEERQEKGFDAVAGDVFVWIAADAAGNLSKPVTVTVESSGLYRVPDGRPTTLLKDKVQLERTRGRSIRIFADRAVEPNCSVTILNGRTHEEVKADVDMSRSLDVEIDAVAGDPIVLVLSGNPERFVFSAP